MSREGVGTPRVPTAFVRRLEDRIARLVDRWDRVALAYSGGLASTLLAMIARKRCDLECFVAGSSESADVRAAASAKQHFDYRITTVLLDAAETRRVDERMQASSPGLMPDATAALLPLAAVLERDKGQVWLAGFGSPSTDPVIAAEVQRLDVRTPFVDVRGARTVPRSLLRDAATLLGLPDEWARVRHRAPANGAGIAQFLRSPARTVP